MKKLTLTQEEISYLQDILDYQQEQMFYTKDTSWSSIEDNSQEWHDKKNLTIVDELINKLTL